MTTMLLRMAVNGVRMPLLVVLVAFLYLSGPVLEWLQERERNRGRFRRVSRYQKWADLE